MKKDKHENDPFLILVFVCIGVAAMVTGTVVQQFELAVLCFTFGVGFSLFGVGLMLNLFRVTEKKFAEDKSGALWIWAVCLLSIVVLAMGWFTLTWPTFIIIEYIESVYTFPPEASNAITLIKTVMGWFLILMALGLLLWAYVMSQRREDVTYPIS